MHGACCDSYEATIERGDTSLIKIIRSPAHNGSVGLEAQTVKLARGDGHEAAVGCRDVRLTTVVVSPCHDGAVGLESQAVVRACGYLRERSGVYPDNPGTPADNRALRRISDGGRRHKDPSEYAGIQSIVNAR